MLSIFIAFLFFFLIFLALFAPLDRHLLSSSSLSASALSCVVLFVSSRKGPYEGDSHAGTYMLCLCIYLILIVIFLLSLSRHFFFTFLLVSWAACVCLCVAPMLESTGLFFVFVFIPYAISWRTYSFCITDDVLLAGLRVLCSRSRCYVFFSFSFVSLFGMCAMCAAVVAPLSFFLLFVFLYESVNLVFTFDHRLSLFFFSCSLS